MYIIIEMQTNGSQTALLPAETRLDRLQADSVYYQKLAAAAISTVPIHSVVMLDEHGNRIDGQTYEHVS